jgi:hypothetical protein
VSGSDGNPVSGTQNAAGPGATLGNQPPLAAQNHVVVSLTSNPPGAQISVDGKVYGETPADIEWWGEQATPGREVSFIFTKEGYEKATVVRSVVAERLSVEAQLVRTPSAQPRPRPRSSEPRNNSPAPVVMPDNFKDDPY